MYLAAGLISLAAGFLSGLFGIGGAILTTPAIRCLLGFSGLIALGTPLPAVIPTTISGAYVYYRSGHLRVKTGLTCGLAGSCSALLGAAITQYLGGEIMMFITSGFILLVALRFAMDGNKTRSKSDGESAGRLTTERTIIIGLGAGFLAGFLGIGGGVVLVPALVILLGLRMHEALGTSLMAISIYAIPGSIEHYVLGHVNLQLLVPIVIGCVLGAQIGARFAIRVRERRLKKGFSVFLAAVAVFLAVFEFFM